jgi:hypothetical protein
MRKTNLIDSKDSPRRLTRLVAVGLVVGTALLQAAPNGRPADICDPAGSHSGDHRCSGAQ